MIKYQLHVLPSQAESKSSAAGKNISFFHLVWLYNSFKQINAVLAPHKYGSVSYHDVKKFKFLCYYIVL